MVKGFGKGSNLSIKFYCEWLFISEIKSLNKTSQKTYLISQFALYKQTTLSTYVYN